MVCSLTGQGPKVLKVPFYRAWGSITTCSLTCVILKPWDGHKGPLVLSSDLEWTLYAGGTTLSDFLTGVVPPKSPNFLCPHSGARSKGKLAAATSVPECGVLQREAPTTSITCGTDGDLLIRDRDSDVPSPTLRGP